MNIVKNMRYRVIIHDSNCLVSGEYDLIFRGVFVDFRGIIMFRFSDSLKEDSKFYNLFLNHSEFLIRSIF